MIIDPPIHVPLCPAVTLWSHFQAVGTVELQRETGTTAPPPLPSLPWLNILASFSVICDQSLLWLQIFYSYSLISDKEINISVSEHLKWYVNIAVLVTIFFSEHAKEIFIGQKQLTPTVGVVAVVKFAVIRLNPLLHFHGFSSVGPKLFKEPSAKSNKPIIHNAISHCCLAGKVNEPQKNQILEVSVGWYQHVV